MHFSFRTQLCSSLSEAFVVLFVVFRAMVQVGLQSDIQNDVVLGQEVGGEHTSGEEMTNEEGANEQHARETDLLTTNDFNPTRFSNQTQQSSFVELELHEDADVDVTPDGMIAMPLAEDVQALIPEDRTKTMHLI